MLFENSDVASEFCCTCITIWYIRFIIFAIELSKTIKNMNDIELKIAELLDSLKILCHELDYVANSIRAGEPEADQQLETCVLEAEVLKEQLASLSREVYSQEEVTDFLRDGLLTCHRLYQAILAAIENPGTTIEWMDAMEVMEKGREGFSDTDEFDEDAFD